MYNESTMPFNNCLVLFNVQLDKIDIENISIFDAQKFLLISVCCRVELLPENLQISISFNSILLKVR